VLDHFGSEPLVAGVVGVPASSQIKNQKSKIKNQKSNATTAFT
jgi:hypothetical protein